MPLKKQKIIFVGNTGFSLFNYRLGVIRRLISKGFELITIANDEKDYQNKFVKEGIKFISVPIDHKGLNAIKDLILIFRLLRIYRREKPALVHHFTIKPIIMGSIAARMSGVKSIVNTITGLGYSFEKRNWLRSLVVLLYRFAMKGNVKIIFQNKDNLELFIRLGICKPSQARLVRGSGIDTIKYSPKNNFVFDNSKPIFFIATRMLWSKGIKEFVEMAEIVRHRYPEARFIMAGGKSGDGAKGNPKVIPDKWLEEVNNKGCVEWLGKISFEKVMEILSSSYAAVMPSSLYQEGLPRFLLEAASMGKPMVAFDIPGCREVVVDGENGYLVKTISGKGLAEAVLKLLQNPELSKTMGENARTHAIEYFDDEKIFNKTLDVYDCAGFAAT